MALTRTMTHAVEGTARHRGAHAGAGLARTVFIDKDGTLVEDVPYNVDPALLRFTPNALEGLRLLAGAGYRLVLVTNQPGVALGRFDKAAWRALQVALTRLLGQGGVTLDGIYACLHAPATPGGAATCGCRKPAAGLLREAAETFGLDLGRSWMVGDILDDVEAGHRAGCRSVLLDVGNETLWQRSPMRIPDLTASDLLEAAQEIIARDTKVASAPRPAVRAVHGGSSRCTE